MLIPSRLEMIAMAQHISKPSVWPWSAKVQGNWAGSGDEGQGGSPSLCLSPCRGAGCLQVLKKQDSPARAELGLAGIVRLSRACKLGSRRAVRALPRAAPCASLHLPYGKAGEQPPPSLLHAERQLWLPGLEARMETASYGV